MSDIEISKVVIKIGDKESELTLEQARDLKDALIDLLGEKDKVVHVPYPYPVYPEPYVWRRPYWTVTYSDHTVTGTSQGGGWTGNTQVTYSLNG